MKYSNLLLNLLRVLLVPMLMWQGFVIYGFSLDFFSNLIPIPAQRSLIYGAFMAQSFLASAVVSAVFSHAIAWIYRRFALVVAVLVALPVLTFILPEVFDSSRHPFALVISGYNVLAYTVLVIAGVWIAQKQRLKTKTAMDNAR
jgi:hypothetical protein